MKVNLRPTKALVLIEVENNITIQKRLKSKEELANMPQTAGLLTVISEEDAYETYEEVTPSDKCHVIRVGNLVTEVKEGDYCMFSTRGGHEIKFGDKVYKLIKEEEILLVIE